MGAAVKWGVILAAVVTVFNGVWVVAGLHTSLNGAVGYLAFVTIVDIIAVVFALKAGAAENPYLKQVMAGLVLGIVGGVLIFSTSLIMLTSVFPEAIPDQIAGFTKAYEELPLADEQKQQAIDALQGVNAWNSAFQGAMGTLFTSLIVGAIAAIFLRKKA